MTLPGTGKWRELRLHLGVNAIHKVVRAAEVQPWADALNAEVVFLIDHDADALLAINDDAAAIRARSVLPADKVALHEHLLLDLAGVFVVLAKSVLHFWQCLNDRADIRQHLDALFFLAKAREGVVAEIASKADTGGHDHIGMRSATPHPVGGVFDQSVESHHVCSLTKSLKCLKL